MSFHDQLFTRTIVYGARKESQFSQWIQVLKSAINGSNNRCTRKPINAEAVGGCVSFSTYIM